MFKSSAASSSWLVTLGGLVIGFVAGIAYTQILYEANSVKRFHVPVAPAAVDLPVCSRPEVLTQYFSSDLELAWLSNAAGWEKDFCKAIAAPAQQRDARIWVDTIAKLDTSRAGQIQELSPAIYSRFETTVTCRSASKTFTTWIEPLSHGLRHPQALCDPAGQMADVMDMNYLLTAQQGDVVAIRNAAQQTCTGRDCQNIYMDLGATTWSNNDKEAGQGWFVRHYRRHGIDFDRMLLWEAKPIQPPSSIYAELPQDLLHKYQYFNTPATSNSSWPSHPVNVLKKIAQPGDFVVFKLDIDNSDIEIKILNTMLNDPEALALVDEFYFEHHVNFTPMKGYWGDSIDQNTSLSGSYQLFLKLRQKGWRAHSWV